MLWRRKHTAFRLYGLTSIVELRIKGDTTLLDYSETKDVYTAFFPSYSNGFEYMKFKRNRINKRSEMLNLMSRDLEVEELNGFCMRISAPGLTDTIVDWYHTTGTVMLNRYTRLNTKYFNAGAIADLFNQEGLENFNDFYYSINK